MSPMEMLTATTKTESWWILSERVTIGKVTPATSAPFSLAYSLRTVSRTSLFSSSGSRPLSDACQPLLQSYAMILPGSKIYLEMLKCEQRECPDRHPKLCKWLQSSGGCIRQNCLYLHEKDGYYSSGSKQFSCAKLCGMTKSVWQKTTLKTQKLFSVLIVKIGSRIR